MLQISTSVPVNIMEDAFTSVSTSLETTDARATTASVWPTMDTTAWVSHRLFHSHACGPELLKNSHRHSDNTFASGSISERLLTTANLVLSGVHKPFKQKFVGLAIIAGTMNQTYNG